MAAVTVLEETEEGDGLEDTLSGCLLGEPMWFPVSGCECQVVTSPWLQLLLCHLLVLGTMLVPTAVS